MIAPAASCLLLELVGPMRGLYLSLLSGRSISGAEAAVEVGMVREAVLKIQNWCRFGLFRRVLKVDRRQLIGLYAVKAARSDYTRRVCEPKSNPPNAYISRI